MNDNNFRSEGGGYSGYYSRSNDNKSASGGRKRSRWDNDDQKGADSPLVVEVTNLPLNVTEADLFETFREFGPIAYIFVVSASGIALVEYEDTVSAAFCVSFAQHNPIYVCNQRASINYSTVKMIERNWMESRDPSPVIVMTVTNVRYPITVKVIESVAMNYGRIMRIIIVRAPFLQAFVEYDCVESARNAKNALNGADIYTDCCSLKVEFAKKGHLEVARNDSDQWDYTSSNNFRPQLQDNTRGALPGGRYQSRTTPLLPLSPAMWSGSANMGVQGTESGILSYQVTSAINNPGRVADSQQNGNGFYGTGTALTSTPLIPAGNFERRDDYSNHPYVPARGGQPHGDNFYLGERDRKRRSGMPPYDRERKPREGSSTDGNTSVILMTGLNRSKINCDGLFNILCQYGNVNKILFMKTRDDAALVEMGNPEQAQLAIEKLNGFTIFGKSVALLPSFQTSLHPVRHPDMLPDGSPSYIGYERSRNQRYTTPELANKNRKSGPSKIVHFFNAPPSISEKRIRQILKDEAKLDPLAVRLFPQVSERSQTGIIEFETVEEGIEAVAKCCHTPVESPFGNRPFIVKFAFFSESSTTGAKDIERQ